MAHENFDSIDIDDNLLAFDGPMPSLRRTAGFLMDLGRALNAYGSPAHRLEAALTIAAERIGLAAHFFSTPTAIMASFERGEEHHSMLARVHPGDIDLEKLSRLDRLVGEVARGGLGVETARAQVQEVVDTPARYSKWSTLFSFGVSGSAAAAIMGGGAGEVISTLLIGFVISGLIEVAARLPSGDRLFEPLAAIVASFLATACSIYVEGLNPLVVTMASLIVLLPGLSVTVAITELATRHLVSGSSRLWGAMVVFFSLAFGVVLGTRLSEVAFRGGSYLLANPALPTWLEYAAWIVAPLTFVVLFRAHPRDALQILAVGVVALAAARFATQSLGAEMGAFFGALTLGISGLISCLELSIVQPPLPSSLDSYSWFRAPYRSLASLVDQETLSGIQTAFTTSFVAVALATGLLVAGVLLPPRRAL